MKKLILLFVFFFAFQSINAQIHFPDDVQNNREKAIYLNKLALQQSQLDSSLFYTKKAIVFAKKSKSDSLLYVTTYNLSFFPAIHGKFDVSIQNLSSLDSLLSIKKSNYYSFRKSTLLAYAYKMKDELNLSLNYYKKAIENAKLLENKLFLADAYNNIGDVYLQQNLTKEANKYFVLAHQLFNELKIKENTNRRQINYKNLAMSASSFEDAKLYSTKANKIAEKGKNKHTISLSYLAQGEAYINIKRYKEAKIAALTSYKIAKKIKFDLVTNIALLQLGQANYYLGNYTKAINYLEEAINTQKQDNLQNHQQILDFLAKSYAKNNQFDRAYNISKKATAIKDSLNSLVSTKEFAEFDAKFKTAQKDKEIVKQQLLVAQQKGAKNKIIGIGIILLLLAYALFQWFYNKQKRKKITSENELQKEQEINELRTKFLGNIAHEIRTPLTLISGNLELAKEHIDNNNKALQNIDIALTNSKKVVEDANEILELLKFEKKKTTIKLNDVNLETTLKRIFYSFKSLATLKNIDLDYQSDFPKDFVCKIDVEKVEKILNNLVSNAIKYSPSNSRIIFNATLQDNNLQIKVTDFGQGIHFNETEKIFQRFYQASNSKSVGGIGIGLSLAKEFATLLNGTLTVKSVLQKGSTFTLTLPLITENVQLVDDEKDQKLIQRKEEKNEVLENTNPLSTIDEDNKPRLLIVEDNPEMSNYLHEILSSTYHCTQAFDGLEALEMLKTTSFDVITSDIMMPHLDGFEFRAALNKNEQFKNIPFILISAKTLEEDKIKGFQLGIDDYIIKPFNKNELLARINNLLKNKQQREAFVLENKNLISSDESSDKKLLHKIESVILENISDETFKISELAKNVGYSQRQLTRLLKQYSGMSPVKFILEIRLQKAYQNLQNNTFFSLSEVRYDVGLTSSSYFNKKFKERFGIHPSELLKS